MKATGYVTVAERPLDPAMYPGADPALLVPGALVFHKTAGPVDLDTVDGTLLGVEGVPEPIRNEPPSIRTMFFVGEPGDVIRSTPGSVLG